MTVLWNSRKFVEVKQETSWPNPIADVEGVKTFKGDDFARVRGWSAPHPSLAQTNMVTPMFYLENGVPVFSKDILRLDKRMYWVDEWFKEWLGDFMWGLYCQPRFGWQDGNDENTDPNTGPFKQQTIDSGCNLRKLVGEPFWTRAGQYQQIEAIDFYSDPDPTKINYKLTPHLVEKQVVASASANEPVAYITHQKHGDLVWPNLYVNPLIHSIQNLEKFPKIPFETAYLGTPVILKGFCFQASKVYGLFDDGWRVIEESLITGKGSAFYDRQVHVSKWLKTPPPTIRGETRERPEKFDWQL